MSHFSSNPSLCKQWAQNWHILYDYHHWEETKPGVFIHQPSQELLEGCLIPGIHFFNSQKEFIIYLQRFPFLMQEDNLFGPFLELHQWEHGPHGGGNRKMYHWKDRTSSE